MLSVAAATFESSFCAIASSLLPAPLKWARLTCKSRQLPNISFPSIFKVSEDSLGTTLLYLSFIVRNKYTQIGLWGLIYIANISVAKSSLSRVITFLSPLQSGFTLFHWFENICPVISCKKWWLESSGVNIDTSSCFVSLQCLTWERMICKGVSQPCILWVHCLCNLTPESRLWRYRGHIAWRSFVPVDIKRLAVQEGRCDHMLGLDHQECTWLEFHKLENVSKASKRQESTNEQLWHNKKLMIRKEEQNQLAENGQRSPSQHLASIQYHAKIAIRN